MSDPKDDDDRLLESLRHEIAKQELEDYQPTEEELREVEPMVQALHQRIAEKRREALRARVADAVEQHQPTLAERSREWLLARLAELRELARTIPGGVQLAHRNLDVRAVDAIPTEEIRSQVADLEVVIAVELERAKR